MNFGFLGKGNASTPAALVEQVRAGAMGLKLHEDWGTTPAAIDTALTVADEHDVQVAIHTDTLNESGFVENTIAAFKGRTIHTYHSEGAGGGHAPDILRVCAEPNVLPVEHESDDALHGEHARRAPRHAARLPSPELAGARRRRVRRVAHPSGDDGGRGRAARSRRDQHDVVGLAGDGARRRSDRADVADRARDEGGSRGSLAGDAERTTTSGSSAISRSTRSTRRGRMASRDYVGSIEVGKIADLVLWSPAFFGVKPDLVLKGGLIAASAMGDPNASIPTPEPVRYRPMFAAFGRAAATTSWTFVSGASLDGGRLPANLDRTLLPVATRAASARRTWRSTTRCRRSRSTRSATRSPSTASASRRGRPPSLPLAQRYFLF